MIILHIYVCTFYFLLCLCISFVIGELLSEVGGRVGHGLVLAWFELYVLRLVSLDSSLQSPGQEKHFGILFVPLRVVVREIHCL